MASGSSQRVDLSDNSLDTDYGYNFTVGDVHVYDIVFDNDGNSFIGGTFGKCFRS